MGGNHRPYNGLKGTIISAFLPNGSILSIAASYAAPVSFTALTNATPPVATATAHGMTAGDIVEVSSGWGGLNDRVLRLGTTATNTFAFEGVDTTSTTRYPVGTGIGSVRKVLTWAQLSQVTGAAGSGGEQNFLQYVFLEDGIQRQKATYKNARSLKLTIADDPNLAFYVTLRAADDDQLNRALRLALPNGGFIYYNCQVSFNDEPTLTANELMAVDATMSQAAKFIRYAS